MQSVIVLNVTYKPFMLSVIMLNHIWLVSWRPLKWYQDIEQNDIQLNDFKKFSIEQNSIHHNGNAHNDN